MKGDEYGIKYIAVGDGYGSVPTPTEDDTALVHEVWRGEISEIGVNERAGKIDPQTGKTGEKRVNEGTSSSDLQASKNGVKKFTAVAYIPESAGDFVIRELGLFDENNNLLFVSQMDETPKKATSSGLVKQIGLKVIFELQNGLSAVIVDPSTVTASTNFVEENYQKLREKDLAGGYAGVNDEGIIPLNLTSNVLPVFCFNSGRVDENGESALCSLENNVVTLHAPAVCTTANGKTYKIEEDKTLNISGLIAEDGSLNVFYNAESGELTQTRLQSAKPNLRILRFLMCGLILLLNRINV